MKGEQIESMADDWKKGFAGIAPVLRGNNERVPGWRLMREMIDSSFPHMADIRPGPHFSSGSQVFERWLMPPEGQRALDTFEPVETTRAHNGGQLWNVLLRPLVPVIYMQVSAAN